MVDVVGHAGDPSSGEAAVGGSWVLASVGYGRKVAGFNLVNMYFSNRRDLADLTWISRIAGTPGHPREVPRYRVRLPQWAPKAT